MDIFGSMARGDGGSDCDIDLIIEFEEPKARNISGRFFGFLHEMEDRFACIADILIPRSIKNPFLKKTIQKDRIRIFG